MKTTTAILVALTCGRLSAEDFTTTDGRKFRGVTVSRVEPDGVTVVTDSGITKIWFAVLPEDVRKKYRYDPKAAAEYSAFLFKAADAANSEREKVLREQQVKQDVQRKMQDEQRAKQAEAYAEQARKPTQAEADTFLGITEAALIQRLGRPIRIETRDSPDGPFKLLEFDQTKGRATFFIIFADDRLVQSGMFRGVTLTAK